MAVGVSTQGIKIVAADGEVLVSSSDLQGLWTAEQYIRLTNVSNRLIEFTDGSIEVLPMPTKRHQMISLFLLRLLLKFLDALGGAVFYAPLRLRVREDKYREPDLIVALDANDPRLQDAYFLGADLVIEIVSSDDPKRDTVEKRADYAEAGIPEYWIVDPQTETITVLQLAEDKYEEHGVFRRGDRAASVLLEGFAVDVNEVFDAY